MEEDVKQVRRRSSVQPGRQLAALPTPGQAIAAEFSLGSLVDR